MSLLLRDQVRIALCADRLLVVRLARGWRPRVVAKQAYPFTAAGADWKPALSMLASVLQQDQWQRADAVVILSNRFARYQLLPWSDQRLNRNERRALAEHVYAQAYGDTAAALELRVGEGAYGAPTLASGIDSALAAAIRAAFEASTLKLVSLQPYLMSAFNGWRRTLTRESQWFVLLEADTMCAALLHQGRWRTVRTRQLSGNWFEEMELALHREQLALGLAEKISTVALYIPEAAHGTLPAAPEWSFRRLQLRPVAGFAPVNDGMFGMALAGAL